MKTVKAYRDKEVIALQDKDIDALRPAMARASEAWADDFDRAGGEYGSHCIGQGIEVWYLAPRKRIPYRSRIVAAPGQTSAEHCMKRAMAILKRALPKGVELRYNCGSMN